MNIVYIPIKKEKKKCLCCGKDIFVCYPTWEQNFCDNCYKIICRELFNNQNDKLTIKELRNKIKILI